LPISVIHLEYPDKHYPLEGICQPIQGIWFTLINLAGRILRWAREKADFLRDGIKAVGRLGKVNFS
jgi:hypothetical protein